MISVFCVCTNGKYDSDYVIRLKDAVSRNLSVSHSFHCITDRPFLHEGIIFHTPSHPYLVGWWHKITLFERDAYGIVPDSSILYLDLDVVITGTLDPLLSDSTFRIWRRGPHSRFNSSAFTLMVNRHTDVWDMAMPELGLRHLQHMDGSDGDQEWMSRVIPNAPSFTDGLVRSYRDDCLNHLPDGTSVVAFHGTPKPREATSTWIKEFLT